MIKLKRRHPFWCLLFIDKSDVCFNLSGTAYAHSVRVGVVSRKFRKKEKGSEKRSQPTAEASGKDASKCFMFIYFLLPH